MRKLTLSFSAALLFILCVNAIGRPLRIDFNDRSNDVPVHTQEDFDAFVIGGSGSQQTATNTLRYGTITLSIWSDLGIGLDDRRRTVLTNSVNFTNTQILEDFVFNENATSTNSGLSLRIQGLASNQTHQITIWSFDSNSTGNRVSDWYANGVLVKNNYSFNGSVRPTSNTDCHFTFSATANSSGTILIQGRCDSTSVDNTSAPATGVFLNAIEIDSIPDQSPPCGTLDHFQPGSNLYGWTGGATFEDQNQEVANLKEAGVKWVRMNVVWYAVEPTQKGSYDTGLLAFYDNIMARFAEAGIKVIFVTADTPYWASTDPAKTPGTWNTRYAPGNLNDLADYMVFLLNRYRSTGPHAFEIWNEQNENYYWPPTANATNYVNMLRTCHDAIKAADPQAIVLNGGLTDNSSMSNYMATLYAVGAKPYFDAWSQHIYQRTPQYETAIQVVRDVMVANGDAAKKIWVTEAGWTTYTNITDPTAVSYARQAHYLTNFFTRLAAYPFVAVGLWYTSRSYDESTKEGSFGLVLPDFTKKPSFYAFKEWVAAADLHCYPHFLSLSPPTFLPGGTARIGINADPRFVYTVKVSTNLPNWQTLSTNLTGTNSNLIFDDLQASNSLNRFYRVDWPK
ncbi:MAG: cellulase family glycosylhydrolase [Verrucomicrobiales bacterium]|nr:cellulase family glycosylhydrolase [Verrucomicrobiales bacterium]